MTTTALTVAAIRRMIKDEPARLHLNGSVADTTEETVTVDSGEISKVQVGARLEHDDGSGEMRRVLSVDAPNNAFEGERGYLSSTAATHLDNSYMLIQPRFWYDEISQAITRALTRLWREGIYNINERQLTSSADSDYYDLPASTIERVLAVYQQPSGYPDPITIRGFDPDPYNTDTALFASGKFIYIWENAGTAGTDVYYLQCKEPHTISTLTTDQEDIIQNLALYYLLQWEEPRRVAGPTNQGDRTIKPLDNARTAQVYLEEALRSIRVEQALLKTQVPVKRTWRHWV